MITVVMGRPVPAGYWSGELVTVRRARRDYPCACGRPEHAIRKGELYMVVTPDRLASWGGARYVRRLYPAHAAGPIRAVDRAGKTVAVLGQDRTAAAEEVRRLVGWVHDATRPENS